MARKKVDSKDVTPKDVEKLSFFACAELINEIEALAEKNEGVITDEQMEALVEAQTQVPAKLNSLCNFMKLLEAKVKACKDRKKEINGSQKHAEDVHERLSGYLAKFVEAQGKSYHVGEYTATTRKSSSVKLREGFDDPFFSSQETVVVIKPNKVRIKEALLAGTKIDGAELVEKLNLSIK